MTGANVVVFVGPSLSAEEVRRMLPEASVRPPAALGDVFRCLEQRPSTVVLVDGLFERMPAVWHKELLWALDRGVRVLGAASMGALRAAELHRFGMVGVGEVFEQFVDGRLEDDDEVAVAHLDAEDGFRPTSEAMVNIRATVRAGADVGAIAAEESSAILERAKATFYPQRSWDEVLASLRDDGRLTSERAAEIRDWVRSGGRVDQKGEDARTVLRAVADGTLVRDPDVRPWSLELTMYWATAMQDAVARHTDHRANDTPAARVLDELRLEPTEFQRVADAAYVRAVATAFAEARAVSLLPEDTQVALDRLRVELGLHAPDDVHRWLDEQEMSVDDLRSLVRDETRIAWSRALLKDRLRPAMIDVLRREGGYSAHSIRARDKHEVLRERGLDGTKAVDGVDTDELVAWWFDRRSEPVPDDLDEFVLRHALGTRADLLAAIRREYWYQSKERAVSAVVDLQE